MLLKVVIRSTRVDHNLNYPAQANVRSLPSRQSKIALSEALMLLEAIGRYGHTLLFDYLGSLERSSLPNETTMLHFRCMYYAKPFLEPRG
jgi:hypothetical protein